jgi:pyruvate dehydrogenase E1 component
MESTLEGADGPVVAATDYMRAFADQIRPWVRAPYRVLGTDGFGRSDYRKALRAFFEVDRHHVALAALTSLAAEGAVDAAAPGKAIRSYEIDPERPAPWRV